MTTIVAVRTAHHVVIGSDSLLMQGETRLSHDHGHNPKLFSVGDSVLGLSGTVAHYTALVRALREMGADCRLRDEDQVFDTFSRVHKKLKDEYFLNPKRQPDDAYENNHISALVANGSGLYGVYAHREVLLFDKYWSNGSGRGYALGAMHQAWQTAPPQGADALTVARAGLAAGMVFDRGSGGRMQLYRCAAGSTEPMAALVPMELLAPIDPLKLLESLESLEPLNEPASALP